MCAGQVGRDKDGKYPAEFEDEVSQTLENIGVDPERGRLQLCRRGVGAGTT